MEGKNVKVSFEEFKAWAERNRERQINMSHSVFYDRERATECGCALIEFVIDKEPTGTSYRAAYSHARALFSRSFVLYNFDLEVENLVRRALKKSLEDRPKTLGEFIDPE